MNNRFFILRHGETEYLTLKRHLIYPFQGSLKRVGLTKKGRKDIVKSAQELAEKKITIIYSSDFLRTKQTSLIVARTLGLDRSQVFLTPELRDFNLGVYHGKNKNKHRKELGKIFKDFNYKIEKGESINLLTKRMVDFIKKVDRKHKKENILVVSHGEPLLVLESFIQKKKIINDDFTKRNYIQAGEWRELEVYLQNSNKMTI